MILEKIHYKRYSWMRIWFREVYLFLFFFSKNILVFFSRRRKLRKGKNPYSIRFKGRLGLTMREGNHLNCIACEKCVKICPSKAIVIFGKTESGPELFEFKSNECLYCGLCVKVCPCDAIKMTRVHDFSLFSHQNMSLDKKELIIKPTMS